MYGSRIWRGNQVAGHGSPCGREHPFACISGHGAGAGVHWSDWQDLRRVGPGMASREERSRGFSQCIDMDD